MTSTLFIQIAAYRDPDLPGTLYNLIQRAANPERLRFGICLQLNDDDPVRWRSEAFPDHPHIKTKTVRSIDSRGACWARKQAQTFFNNEDFLLQIDSHMRAVDNWDELLIETWSNCCDPRAVVSVYPNEFTPPCRLQTATLPVMGVAGFDDYGLLKLKGISLFQLPKQQPKKPIPSAFIAGGFLFGPGSIINDVPYDPELYFHGEEVALSARLWTSGYNIYAPNRLLLFHLYKSEKAKDERPSTHWDDHSQWFELNRKSIVRVHTLLSSLKAAPSCLKPTIDDVDDLNLYWLGEQRSLDDYQKWCGVFFSKQLIQDDARSGQFPARSSNQ